MPDAVAGFFHKTADAAHHVSAAAREGIAHALGDVGAIAGSAAGPVARLPDLVELPAGSPAGAKPTADPGAPPSATDGPGAKPTLTAEAFMKLSPDDMMREVRAGAIPPAVLESKQGMLQLQSKIEHISEMNNLLTQMLNSIHQMNMAIVQNIRA